MAKDVFFTGKNDICISLYKTTSVARSANKKTRFRIIIRKFDVFGQDLGRGATRPPPSYNSPRGGGGEVAKRSP